MLRARVLLAVLPVLVTALVFSAPAQAHQIRECGAYGFAPGAERPDFIPDGELDGAGSFNITARAVSCGTAHRIVKRWTPRRRCQSACYIGTFRCVTRQRGLELSDTRCKSSRSRHYVVHWQSGA